MVRNINRKSLNIDQIVESLLDNGQREVIIIVLGTILKEVLALE